MASIDDRVVSMSFESTKFASGVSQTLNSLQKLNDSLKKVGTDNGLDNIEKSANKIQFAGLGTAIDKLKSKLGFGREAAQGFGEIDQASNKVSLTGASTALDKFKQKLGFVGVNAAESFSSVEQASGKVELRGLGQALDSVTGKFSILSGAAAVALGNITTKAITAGTNFAKSFTIQPLIDGFHNYETQINAVQTILANTGLKGKAGLGQVNAALQNLNKYANLTVYNFSEMAKNIGTFTAAGVDLKTSTAAIKGIANLAALSGSNSQQASTAMYQLSQAISAGRVGLQDWNSVVNAGMGGSVFQRALAMTATKMGTLKDSALKLSGPMKTVSVNGESFRNSISAKPGEQSWLTSKVLTTTLKQFTGDLSDAQLKAQGFSDAEVKSIQEQAKVAVGAATKIKTVSQLTQALKEEVGSAYASVFKTIFGNINQATKLFSAIHTSAENALTQPIYALNKLLEAWSKLGGRAKLIDGLSNVMRTLGKVIAPIKDAFHEIFPPATAKNLLDITNRFGTFTKSLKIGPATVENLKRTFKGFFAILDVGKQIVGGIFDVIKELFGAVSSGSGGFLSFTGSIGDALVAFDQWLKQGDKLKTFFKGLGSILAIPIRLIGVLASALGSLFGAKNAGGISSTLSGMGDQLKPLSGLVNGLKKAWGGLVKIFGSVKQALQPVVTAVSDAFGGIVDQIGAAIKQGNWDAVFKIVEVTLIGGIFVAVKKALKGGLGGLNLNFGGKGAFDSVAKSLDVLRQSLVSIQTSIKAYTLVLIAGAIGVLTASVVALSLIDSAKLAKSMTAVAVGLGQLVGAMALITKIGGGKGLIGKAGPIAQMIGISAAMILLAAAIDVLVIAVAALSRLNWEQLAKGLAGVTGLLAAVSAATIPLSSAGPRMIIAGAGLILVGVALNALAASMKIFATMKWGDMAKGLAGVVVALDAVGLAVRLIGPQILIVGPGLILMGIGLSAIAGAVLAFGSQSLATLGKGLGAIAVAMVAIGLAMDLMPPTLPLTAAGLILVGIGLTGVAGAIAVMGHLSIGTLAKGIVSLAAVLVVLAAGLTLMIASLPGAAALLVAAGALAVLAPVLDVMGNMKFSTIFKGLFAIAGVLVTIGVAGTVAAPGLIALSAGLIALGVGVLAVGTGVYLLAKGLVLLGSDGSKGVAVVIAALTGLIAVLPHVIIEFVKGLVSIVKGIADIAPSVVNSMVKIISSLVDVLIRLTPKVAQAATVLITSILKVIGENFGPILQAGIHIVDQLLRGIASNISKVVSQVADIIVKFLDALTGKFPSITAAGARALAALLQGIANNISKVLSKAGDVVAKFIIGIGNNLGKIITAGGTLIGKFVAGIVNAIGKVVTAGAQAIEKFIVGLGKNAAGIVRAGTTAIINFINGLSSNAKRLANAAGKTILDFLNALNTSIDFYLPQIVEAGISIGEAIPAGIIKGINNKSHGIFGALLSPVNTAVNLVKKKLGVKSPSTVFEAIGKNIVEGLGNGLVAMTSTLHKSITLPLEKLLEETTHAKHPGETLAKNLAHALSDAPSRDEIKNAFDYLQGRLKDGHDRLKTQIESDKSKLKQLEQDAHPDMHKIYNLKADIKANEDLLKSSTKVATTFMASLKSEKAQLYTLAGQYEDLTQQLQDAQTNLDNLVKAREDAIKSTTDQFASLPDINLDSKDPLAGYEESIGKQTAATQKFMDTLTQLRNLGLDDTTLRKLLSDGTKDQKFADELLAGGQGAIAQLNYLDSQLIGTANTMATRLETSLAQVGINAAQAVIDGIKTHQGEIADQMSDIADAIVKAIKKRLGIKSPSTVFTDIGNRMMEGWSNGVVQNGSKLKASVADAANGAVDAATSMLNNLPTIFSGVTDVEPTITPVLDLTKVKQGASQLSDLTNVTPISTAASFGQASSISSLVTDSTAANDVAANGAKIFKFEQNITAPEALSETEIYRQTRNQLSQAKSALGFS